ncbi:MAG: response regulator [Anaerolineae bacterium]|jgi:CheY-like chemotaxis protein|nr:response regulator [Anaerolineae bacterium]
MSAFRVLVVEDEVALRVIYDRILRGLHCDVVAARDGEEALHLLEQYTPELVFLDILLPYVNGIQVMQYMATQERLRQVPVVMVSSASEYEQQKNILPFAEFYLKPILASQIKDIARRYINARS